MFAIAAAGVAFLLFTFGLVTHLARLDEAAVDLTLGGLIALSLAVLELVNRPRT